jgi:2-polyprenyl-3-methyl-5-hydroxy-6-metoxy-1,4-benzoquinol methylase
MTVNEKIADLASLKKYTDLLRSEEFLSYLQGRISYDISKIKKQYFNYIEEAEYGVKLLSKVDLEGKRVLEIGSGAGILTSWLIKNDVDVIGIEPSAIGYDFHKDIFTAIWDYFDLPADKVYDLSAEQLDPAVVGMFDLIFSLNVMEHIPSENLGIVFAKMKTVLKQDGFMYHHCPNYIIPFEPHYGIPLVPFFPGITGRLKGIDKEGVWKSLNFITLFQVKNITKNLNLKVDFKKQVMKETFTRLEIDKEFASRHPALTKVYGVMKKVGIISLLGLIPPVLCTPMTFTVRHSNKISKIPAVIEE